MTTCATPTATTPVTPTSNGYEIALLREYFEASFAALKELKAHDIIALHGKIDSLEGALQTAVITTNQRQDIMFTQSDLRYQQRFDASSLALAAALGAAKEAVAAALQAAKEAVNKAEIATEKRFDAVNEFRSSLTDLTRTMMPRTEADGLIKAQADKIDVALARLDKSEGRTGATSSSITFLVAVGAVLVSLFGVFYVGHGYSQSAPSYQGTPIGIDSKRVDDLTNRMDALSNKLITIKPSPP
jgi:hypothetical protein